MHQPIDFFLALAWKGGRLDVGHKALREFLSIEKFLQVRALKIRVTAGKG